MNQPQQINGLPVAMSGGTVHPPGNIQAPADLGVAAAGWNGLGAVVPTNPAFGAATPPPAPGGRWGLPAGPGWTVLKLAIAGGLLYAGYKRGVKVEKKNLNKRLILPFLGWSLLGPVGPGYLIGRLTTD